MLLQLKRVRHVRGSEDWNRNRRKGVGCAGGSSRKKRLRPTNGDSEKGKEEEGVEDAQGCGRGIYRAARMLMRQCV